MREETKRSHCIWGPYSKKYMGISRIMEESGIEGSRFDLVVYPTYANSSVSVPNVTVPSDYHPWDCDPYGTYFQFRYELQWKDQLYEDVDLFQYDAETWGIRVEYVNRTDKSQNCLLNIFTAIEYPSNVVCTMRRPSKCDDWKATAYERFDMAVSRPWEHLHFDGLRRGETIRRDFTESTALGETMYARMYMGDKRKMFGGNTGDCVVYEKNLEYTYSEPVLQIRYVTYEEEEDIWFDTNYGPICFKAAKTPAVAVLKLPGGIGDVLHLEMTARGTVKNGILLDRLCVTEAMDVGQVTFLMEKRNVIPKISVSGGKVKYEYHYGEKPIYLDIFSKRVRSRKLYSGCLEDALITRLTNSDSSYDHLTRSFSGAFMEKHSDEGFYHTNVVEAIFLPGNSRSVQYACVGTTRQVLSKSDLENAWQEKIRHTEDRRLNLAGDPYRFPARLMKSALFSNVVYPIYRHGSYIVHYTPGKRWDSLYTWDSGFIGLGLLEYSRQKAEFVLDTYLSEEGNTDFAFLAHGSLVPTQFYLWNEMLLRAGASERDRLRIYYPMLRRYYRFMAGRSEKSTMARLHSGMLTVYDYFYNAGGMDDYPPQVAMHKQKLSEQIAPVCSSVHFIRIAKIMRNTASVYGYEQDAAEYEEDIHRVSQALLTHSWDEESGYFGYVLHHKDGGKTEIFRTETGENYNRGIDGVTPLIAGIGSPEQQARMLAHLRSDRELWSQAGISTVDQSASYYYDNGYWNGAVWFPYQYLLWKAMLDIGEMDFAYEIANVALRAWKQETDFSYHTFEMIQIATERGGWFHQFGGLSSPIVIWYHAYYRQGTVTAGFDTWIDECIFEEAFTACQIRYSVKGGRHNHLIVVMNERFSYCVEVNGRKIQTRSHADGALEVPLDDGQGEIRIWHI